MEMTKEDLLKLYELSIDEEHFYVEGHQDRIAFYMGLITAIVAIIGAGMLQASEPYHFAALCLGPILIFIVSSNAQDGTIRPYQRFLETVTVRAKIEQELGLTQQAPAEPDSTRQYWSTEPIIAMRHVTSRKSFESSESFVKEHLTKGYHGSALRLFRGFQWLSGGLLVALLALAISMVL